MNSPTAQSEASPELKVRIHEPLNVEGSFLNPPTFLTSADRFFIRDHFSMPMLDPSTWRLEIKGTVGTPLSLSLADLKAMPATHHVCVLECAGNGRMFLQNQPEGVQWGLGAAACAEWTGVPLRDVLALVRLDEKTVDLVFEGADHGVPEKQYKPKNEVHYARSMPLAAASQPEVLLAYKMNGEDIPAAHGGPVRLIAPGWYSMASVKWLTRITAIERTYQGYFQTVEYTYWKHNGDLSPERVPISEIFLTSQIAHPVMHQQARVGEPCTVYGAAWSGSVPVAKVEVSTDKGITWHEPDFAAPQKDHAWRMWRWEWKPSVIGQQILMSRATDASGNVQPAEHNDDYESYLANHILRIPVEVI